MKLSIYAVTGRTEDGTWGVISAPTERDAQKAAIDMRADDYVAVEIARYTLIGRPRDVYAVLATILMERDTAMENHGAPWKTNQVEVQIVQLCPAVKAGGAS